MTQSDIMSMAEQAGLCCDGTPDSWDTEAIERFAALVAAEATKIEREACAKVCEDRHCDGLPAAQLDRCAYEIRARGEKP